MSVPPSHASFANAWRLAATMAEQEGRDLLVIETGDQRRPYVVDQHRGRGAVVATISAHPKRHDGPEHDGCPCADKGNARVSTIDRGRRAR